MRRLFSSCEVSDQYGTINNKILHRTPNYAQIHVKDKNTSDLRKQLAVNFKKV